MKCWGDNSKGQLDVPKKLKNVKQVSAGGFHNCALDDNGVTCWGDNWSHQLDVPALVNPRQISAGNHHSCALDDRGVVCWGDSYFDEATHSYQQRIVPSLQNPRMVSAGFDHTCAVDDTGVVCWGAKDHGQSDLPPRARLKFVVRSRAQSNASNVLVDAVS